MVVDPISASEIEKSCRLSLKNAPPPPSGNEAEIRRCTAGVQGTKPNTDNNDSISKDCCDKKWKDNRPTIIIITHPPTSHHCDMRDDARLEASNSSGLLREELTEKHSALTSIPSKQQPLKNQPTSQSKKKILEREAAVIPRMRKGGRWPQAAEVNKLLHF